MFEQRLRAIKCAPLAAHHYRERALDCAALTTRHRSIEVFDADFAKLRCRRALGARRYRAHVDDELTLLQRGFDERDGRLDVRRIGHHDEDDLGMRPGLCWI